MRARNKHTGKECEVWWLMCDCGRKCSATDQPNSEDDFGLPNYNAVVDDYEFYVAEKWIDGLEYIKNPYSYWKRKMLEIKDIDEEIEQLKKHLDAYKRDEAFFLMALVVSVFLACFCVFTGRNEQLYFWIPLIVILSVSIGYIERKYRRLKNDLKQG